jgi:hypothetical protein
MICLQISTIYRLFNHTSDEMTSLNGVKPKDVRKPDGLDSANHPNMIEHVSV